MAGTTGHGRRPAGATTSPSPGDTTSPSPGDTTSPSPGATTSPSPGDTTSPSAGATTSPSPSEVESPSLSTPHARARFEYEPGKANEGTKIVMVEWEDDDDTRGVDGTWSVSWEGQTAVLPAEERSARERSGDGHSHRVFFLLPPGAQVPGCVTLVLRPADATRGAVIVWRTNPLPAIFPAAWADAAVDRAGASKGVLHTLWGKKRLATLGSEIEKEQRLFPEGIGLAMAVQEKEWIEATFGLGSPSSSSPVPLPLPLSAQSTSLSQPPSPSQPQPPSLPHSQSHSQPYSPSHPQPRHRERESRDGESRDSSSAPGEDPRSPTSPLSPGGGGGRRLSEKLKGLKLQTSSATSRPTPADEGHSKPLRPDGADVAAAPSTQRAATPAQRPVDAGARAFAQMGPGPATGGVGSIAGVISGAAGAGTGTASGLSSASTGPSNEDEEDLFALPLSPRSPEMTKSPFTFAKSDTMRYLRNDQVQRVA